MSKIRYVYIAGAMTPTSKIENHALEYLENIRKMLTVWGILVHKGYVPFCPAFDFMGILLSSKKFTERQIKDYSLAWLEKCDAVLLLPGWAGSSGARAEVKLAKKLGLKIFLSLEELLGN